MRKRFLVFGLALCCSGNSVARAEEYSRILPGATAIAGRAWEPALLVREQTARDADRRHPVLYVHGATFPSANSIMFKLGGVSWADELNKAGFSVWSFDFAGYGGSERYPDMGNPVPTEGEPLGRAPEAALQIERVVRAIIAETGVPRISIIAHSWGTIATGVFATQHPELVDRLVFFGPIARREKLKTVPQLDPWRFLTVEEQRRRFVEDIPSGHPPGLNEQDFAAWAALYLESDPSSNLREPPSVKISTGPIVDILSAWSGTLAYDPAGILSPIAIVRGAWDSLSNDEDAAWLLSTMRSAPTKMEITIARGTHLMHLEASRRELYRATSTFLLGQ